MTTRTRARGMVFAVGVLCAVGAGCSGPAAPAATPAITGAPTAAPVVSTSAPAATTAPATTPAGTSPPNCATSELAGSLGPAQGAAGSVIQTLVLTNTGNRTCELRGFPGVSYVAGDDGHQVGPAAAMDGPRGGEVVLAPGRSAVAEMKLVNVANYEATVCRPTPVRGLRVYPPGDTASLFVPREGTGCTATPPGDQISVRTLTPA